MTIERSVWSFWTKPYKTHRNRTWLSEKHHLLAWILSVETARKHYPDTALVTDDEGARMLVDGLGLEFESVSTDLNQFCDQDSEWWVLGKLWAYRSQTKPFVHVDSDVFLWNRLPSRLNTAPVMVQNPENFVFGKYEASPWWYRPQIFDSRIKKTGGWLPNEWHAYYTNRRELAFCCGIMGGTQVDFINHYADSALQIVTRPDNQKAFALMENKPGDCLLVEQYFLAACVEYHQQQPSSSHQDVGVRYLFDNAAIAYSPEGAKAAGYTHLIGGSKRDPDLTQRLEKRVKLDYPQRYERCLQYLGAGRT